MVRPVSLWAFNELIMLINQRNANAAYDFYKQIQGTSEAATIRGMMFERRVHEYLHSIKKSTQFQILSLDNRDNTLNIEFPPGLVHEFWGPRQMFEGYLTSYVQKGSSCYLGPVSDN